MIVIVDEALFAAGQVSQLDLVDLIKSCLDGDHALITDPPGPSEEIEGWLARHSPDLQVELRLIIEDGPTAASQRTAAAPRIRVSGVAASELRGPVPTLTLRDALRLLKAPLSLLLENDRNDGAFLRKLAPPEWRRDLDRAIKERRVEVRNGGGIEGVKQAVIGAASQPLRHMRLWVMFDSDAREPGKPSEPSRETLEECRKIVEPWPLMNHQLPRRAIENYIPVQALFAWSEEASGAERTRLRRCAEAYAQRLPRDRREHYNLKGGLVEDVRDARRRRWYRDSGTNIVDESDLHPYVQALRLPEDVRRCLHGGFGADVATLFHDDAEHGIRIEEEWLNREIPHEFRMSIVQSIFDRM